MSGERYVLDGIPVGIDAEQIGRFFKRSRAPLDEMAEVVSRVAKPKAVIYWTDIKVAGPDEVEIDGRMFRSVLLAEKLKDQRRVFLYVATAGNEIKDTDAISSQAMRDTLSGSVLNAAFAGLATFLKERFSLEQFSVLNPGSLPDWPIENNKTLVDIIGDVEKDTGVVLNEAGYMIPWNSSSGIIFPDDSGYQNCMLCRNIDCIGRRAPFDSEQYSRVFGKDPD